jgi:hypothetical protein
MSEALVRVIAEQQAKIDCLESKIRAHANGWALHNQKLEKFCESVFSLLERPNDEAIRTEIKYQLIGFNYCLNCEQTTCECEGRYD